MSPAAGCSPSARIGERILAAAEELFYSQGIQAAGVDAIAAAARVSKRTLYRHFPSKALLVATWLEHRTQALLRHDADPRERILRTFAALEQWFASPRFRGCPFVNAVCELGGDPSHPAVVIAMRLKAERRAWFEQALREAGAPQPAELAEQLMIVFEGAIATAMVRGGDATVARSALAAVETLLRAADLPLPDRLDGADEPPPAAGRPRSGALRPA